MLLTYLKNNIKAENGGGRGPFSDFWYSPIGTPTPAGVKVTDKVAMQTSTVFACVDVLARSIGMLPIILYERTTDKSGKDIKRRASKLGLYRLLHDKPNRWQTPSEWKEMMVTHMLMRGNAYCMLNYGPTGFVDELWPLHPDTVTPQLSENRVMTYKVRNHKSGKETILPQDMVMHLRDITVDGVVGISRIEAARRSIGLATAQETYGSSFFKNGAAIGGALSVPGKLSPDARERARAEVKRDYMLAEQAHKVIVLDEGMRFEKIAITNDEAQFLEARSYQVEDICRFFRVPVHMVGKMEKANFSNVEALGIEFVRYSLLPLMTKFEEAISRDLIYEPNKYFAEISAEMLMRGDTQARATAYTQSWWLTGNEIRTRENLDPIDDPVMDTVQVPLNRGNPGGKAENPNGSNNSPTAAAPALPPANGNKAMLALVDDACRKITSREKREINRIKGTELQKTAKLERFLANHKAYMIATLEPVAAAVHSVTGFQMNVGRAVTAHLEAIKAGTVDMEHSMLANMLHQP